MLKKVSHWLYYFLIFAFLGWIFETIVMLVIDGQFVLRGVLFRADFENFSLFWGFPVIFLYGLGGLVLYYFYQLDLKFKFFKHPVFLFFLTTIVLTILELLASFFTELFFGKIYWRYDWGINFQGRIALVPSLVWGAFATLAMLFGFPALDKLFRKCVKKKWQFWVIIGLSVYILICLLIREKLFPLVYSELAFLDSIW